MLGTVDAIKRNLIIPPRFVPYMEKHRIYELFHELATELLIKRPDDHISYLKQCIQHAALNRDVPRIIVLAPPDFDKMRLAEALQEELGVRPITISDIHQVTSTCMHLSCADAEDFARNLKKILRTGMLNDSGWTLVDCREDGDMVTDFQVSKQSRSVHYLTPEQRAYEKHLRGLQIAYSDSLIEVDVGDRSIEELAKDCAILAKMRKHCGAPSIFRVAIIGSRGSGSRTVARHLCQRFHLVHVDFEKILQQARMQDSPLGKTLRMCINSDCCHLRSKRDYVQKYILDYECMKRGWVLTGYPINEQDFRLLDMLATPPNRVIFLDVDSFTCKQRLLGRRVNMYTGSKHNLTSDNSIEEKIDQLAAHPEDYRSNVERQIKEYEDNVTAMMNYAGASATIIDGSGSASTVRELTEACLMRPAPCAPPRVPARARDINAEDIEFDPDDEIDPRVFDGIRFPEAKVSLI
ncbi:adenylate kinase 8 [Neodiprion fabricii]|uniref:adenylate kinase 8 n=1 Tax=Neodiprion fabricii TaxID=2872261 RepID=UPI001ED96586|nr:adenylate kinase 8 [Neodiprion fabricii]